MRKLWSRLRDDLFGAIHPVGGRAKTGATDQLLFPSLSCGLVITLCEGQMHALCPACARKLEKLNDLENCGMG
jgi:hypothetical protein